MSPSAPTRRTHGPGRASGVFLLLACSVLTGCGLTQPMQVRELIEEPRQQALIDLPFYPQTEYQCGPAALAGVLQAAGVETDPQQLAPQVFLPERRGSLQVELMAATRRAGRIPYVIEQQPAWLLAELEAGRPVLVLQNLRTRYFPVWHYAVLTGFDAETNTLYLNSGEQQGLTVRAPRFLRTWDWAGRWAMVVLRPGEMPASAEPASYARAVAGFEVLAGAEAAEPAWRAALATWPDDAKAHLALGNLAYARGNQVAAGQMYFSGLQATPNEPGLANNLATVLGELGCKRQARQLAAEAVAELPADSNWQPVLADTLTELGVADDPDPALCADRLQQAGLPLQAAGSSRSLVQ